MHLQIFETDHEQAICAITLSKEQALYIARSLLNQIIADSPNVGRAETPCTGQADFLTLVVLC